MPLGSDDLRSDVLRSPTETSIVTSQDQLTEAKCDGASFRTGRVVAPICFAAFIHMLSKPKIGEHEVTINVDHLVGIRAQNPMIAG